MTLTSDATQIKLHQLNTALESGIFTQVKQMLAALPAVDIAHLLESSPPHSRAILWQLIEADSEADILQHLAEDVRAGFLSKMNTDHLLQVATDLDTDDLADLLQELPDKVTKKILHELGTQDRERVEAVLSFPENTAGGIMNTDVVTVRSNITLEVVLRYLRRHDSLPPQTDNILVTDRDNRFLGLLPVATLLTDDPEIRVHDAMLSDFNPIHVLTPSTDVAHLFERFDWVSAPVVDDNNQLLGRITVDDVLDVIRVEADHTLLSQVGLDDEEDTFAPLITSSRRRATWLGINLITAFIASAVIGLFQDTIHQVVALAVLMPIVASMGGIAGTQTLTLVIRGLALGHIGSANARWVLARELGVGLINGILWSTIVGVTAAMWFDEKLIGYLIAFAILGNLIVAVISGTLIPVILKNLNIDPAIAGGVILTTITDVFGFCSFLGLAAWFYH